MAEPLRPRQKKIKNDAHGLEASFENSFSRFSGLTDF